MACGLAKGNADVRRHAAKSAYAAVYACTSESRKRVKRLLGPATSSLLASLVFWKCYPHSFVGLEYCQLRLLKCSSSGLDALEKYCVLLNLKKKSAVEMFLFFRKEEM